MKLKDFRYERNMSAADLVERLKAVGFQATNLARAAEIILRMKKERAKVILTFTSNMGSSGLRGFFAQILSMGFADVVITTVGAIEEDMIKAKKDFHIGSFHADDAKLGEQGINRIGNIFVPSEAYCSFEEIFRPILDDLYKKKKRWLPSEMIREFAAHVDDESSMVFQAAKNSIPIFCPAMTDGAVGMQSYFFQRQHPDFEIELVKDIDNLFAQVLEAEKVGVIALGGGVAKHHAILANLLRDGMDYAVYLTTASPYSGSLSGATTEEAKSWGKIKGDADAVTVHGDVTVTFPLIMASVLDRMSG